MDGAGGGKALFTSPVSVVMFWLIGFYLISTSLNGLE